MNSITAHHITALPAQELDSCAMEAVTPFNLISIVAMAVLVLRCRPIVGHLTGATYLCLPCLVFLGEFARPEHMPAVAAPIAGIMYLDIEIFCLQSSCGLLSVCVTYLCQIISHPDAGSAELLVAQIAFAVFDLIAENVLLRDSHISQQYALPISAVPNIGYAGTAAEDSGLYLIQGLVFKQSRLASPSFLGNCTQHPGH